MGKDGKNAVRVTTTLTKEQYGRLGKIAERNGVKVAWLVRRAVETFLVEHVEGGQVPLTLK
ncbi:MAG: ribbon-helix-helix domain-containing protein [Candidatus Riflebacteria bacterium]|nr:ribbon-helix-helix domain-containing protein [Candidatus Riflebacteria bacterium]